MKKLRSLHKLEALVGALIACAALGLSVWQGVVTASDKFYPDFVVKLTSGVILAIEYKGQDRSIGIGSRDSIEKKSIGDLWAKRSGGTCGFVWVENRNWQALKDAAVKYG